MARSMVLAWFALAAGVSGVAGAQVPVMTFDGLGPSTGLGYSVSRVGDLNGDGVTDFACGGPGYLSAKGVVQVYCGKSGSKLLEAVGPTPSTGFGGRTAAAGDVNGDGTPDLLVGAPSFASAGESQRGAVWVLSGVDGEVIHFLKGDNEYDFFGSSIAGGADLNQDGFDDFVVGMPGFNYNSGGARAFSGRTGSALYTVTKDSLAWGGGAAVAMVDDIDGDGAPDWATPPGFDSSVRFISGSSGATMFIAYVPVQDPNGNFGTAMSAVGDVNGDGFTDLAVGASTESYSAISGGTVRILSGLDGSVLAICAGSQAELIGQAVAGLKDMDGDGVPDVLTNGSYQAGVEKAIVFSGANGARLKEILSPNFDPLDPLAFKHQFGEAVASLDDINGDGIGDFVVGASESHNNGEFSGSVYVYLGGTDSPTAYCTAKKNSAGCTPKIGSMSVASLSVGDQFTVTASKVMSQRIGLLAWSLAPATTPFFGGTLCLDPPITRTSPQDSAGGSAQSCTGSYAFPFSQVYMAQQGFAAGMTVYAQYWQRDPAQLDGTGVGLTDALEFDVVP